MNLLHTLSAVATYERKLLLRSWFFRIFAILAIFPIGFYSFIISKENPDWTLMAIPSNFPYLNLLLLNVGQAIIAIFLASDFIKRDKKLDTSEVFFVKPMSNAAYVLGKTWGSLQLFLSLNVVVLGMSLIANSLADHTWIDWSSYLVYFGLISIPTLIFIIGLSYFLMTVLKNQALTFVILLGYVATTLFYLNEKWYYLLDYIGYSLPMMKSDMVGFANFERLILLRGIYLLAGLTLIGLTVARLDRLPNSKKGRHYTWALSCLLLGATLGCGYLHLSRFGRTESQRLVYNRLNDQYGGTARIQPLTFELETEHTGSTINASLHFEGIALCDQKELIFTLNPGLQVTSVEADGNPVRFEREEQIIKLLPQQNVAAADTLRFTFHYAGVIDQSFCYLDIPEEDLNATLKSGMMKIEKQYAFITPRYVLLTPETYWYPRPGTSYSAKHPDWQQSFFATHKLRVKTAPDLHPISQGTACKDTLQNNWYFENTPLVQAISLVIGNYEPLSVTADSIQYELWIIKGHNYMASSVDSIQDTIPALLKETMKGFEGQRRLSYPFDRLAAIEVPVQFAHYEHLWSKAQECLQPEMILVGERAYNMRQAALPLRVKQELKWNKYNRRPRTETEIKIDNLRWLFNSFGNPTGNISFQMGAPGKQRLNQSGNPYFLFPQLFNFRLNIYSPEWAFANLLIEQYLAPQNQSDWMREYNGISAEEQANLLFQKQPFRELLADPELQKQRNQLIALKALEFFKPGEEKMENNLFRNELLRMIEAESFKNLEFETLLDSLSTFTDYPFKEHLSFWMDSISVPAFEVAMPTTVLVREKSREIYETSVKIRNISDADGLLQMNFQMQGEQRQELIYVNAKQAVEHIVQTPNPPGEYRFYTFISANIPSNYNFGTGKIETVTNRIARKPGTHPISFIEPETTEIIVDDEDEGFSVTEDKRTGLIPWLLSRPDENTTRFSGNSIWRPSVNWITTTDSRYYGKTIRSARVVAKGDGSKYATWTIPIEKAGQYDLYYYTCGYEELRYSHREGTYQFFIQNGDEAPEEITLKLKQGEKGWEQLGIYYINEGTFTVKLTNNTKMRSIAADAVKLVRR